MEIRAKLSNVRVSPRKIRLVVALIRGMKAEEAEHQLMFLNKKSAKPVLKLLQSAIANAENNFKLKKKDLVVKSILANQGFTLHRFMPRAHGRATEIRKKASTVHIVLEDAMTKKPSVKKETAVKPLAKSVKPKKVNSTSTK